MESDDELDLIITDDINRIDKYGYTILSKIHYVRENIYIKKIRKILDLGAKINIISGGRSGNTALMLFAHRDSTIITKLLIEYGPEINIKNDTGNSAITLASIHGRNNQINLLTKFGADNIWKAICWAKFNNKFKSLKILVVYSFKRIIGAYYLDEF